MAATTITDYTIVAKLVEGYVRANFTHKSSLIQSGIIGTIPDANLNYGNTWQVRGDIQYHTRWQTPTAATDLTTRAISHFTEIGVIQRAADLFGFEDAARIAAGDQNALARLGDIIIDAVQYNTEVSFLTYLVPGLFTDSGPLDSDTYMVTTGTPFDTGGADVARARKLHGANGSELSMLLMHPDVYYNAEINRVVTNLDYAAIQAFNERGIMYGGMFNGAMVILNDLVYNNSGTYHSYLCKPGALALGYQKSFGVEADRDIAAAAGTDLVKYDVYYSPHVIGTSFTGTTPTVIGGITDANLHDGATNFSLRSGIAASEIGIVAIETTEA
jgi:hypothetical protein